MSNATVEARNLIIWCYTYGTDRVEPIQCEKLTKRGVYAGGRRIERKNHKWAHFVEKEQAVKYALAWLQEKLAREESYVERSRALISSFMVNEFGVDCNRLRYLNEVGCSE